MLEFQVPATIPNDTPPRSRGAGVYGYNWWVNGIKPDGQRLWPGALPDVFNGLPFWHLQPFDGVTGDRAVALAQPSEVYVVYLPRGGKVSLDLTAASVN
jgi:hypothetical protein